VDKTLLVAALLPIAFDVSAPPRADRVTGYVVAEHGKRVARFDREGRPLWEHACAAYDARDLGGGGVLVTERQAGRVFVVDRDGRVEELARGLNGPVDAERISDKRTLVLENGAGRVVEVEDGRVVWEAGGLSNPYDADRLADGRTLVADSGNNRLVEFDRDGKVVWEKRDLAFPNNVLRLRNGGTLFTTYTSGTVGEVARDGTLLWEHKVEGATLYSVTVERDDVIVADGVNGRVVRLKRDGRVVSTVELKTTFVDLSFVR
jgi:outer membrane protein assembly factor BamB